MVSSISLFRPGAKEISVPMILKPDFWSTRSDARLSLAECGPVVRVGGSERGHPDRLGVTHLVEQRVEVSVGDWS
jgi:hypothetical protein